MEQMEHLTELGPDVVPRIREVFSRVVNFGLPSAFFLYPSMVNLSEWFLTPSILDEYASYYNLHLDLVVGRKEGFLHRIQQSHPHMFRNALADASIESETGRLVLPLVHFMDVDSLPIQCQVLHILNASQFPGTALIISRGSRDEYKTLVFWISVETAGIATLLGTHQILANYASW